MEKLELKHLAPYFPYKLKVYIFDDINFEKKYPNVNSRIEVTINNFEKLILKDKYKPILHPLSNITKEIEHNGEKFVPIIELVKIIADIHNDDQDDKFNISDVGRIIVKTPWDLRVEMFYKTKSISFSIYDTWNHKEKRTINQYLAFEKLFEWHFDIFGLIEKNLAIDINTL